MSEGRVPPKTTAKTLVLLISIAYLATSVTPILAATSQEWLTVIMFVLSVLAIIAAHFVPEKNAGSKPSSPVA